MDWDSVPWSRTLKESSMIPKGVTELLKMSPNLSTKYHTTPKDIFIGLKFHKRVTAKPNT